MRVELVFAPKRCRPPQISARLPLRARSPSNEISLRKIRTASPSRPAKQSFRQVLTVALQPLHDVDQHQAHPADGVASKAPARPMMLKNKNQGNDLNSAVAGTPFSAEDIQGQSGPRNAISAGRPQKVICGADCQSGCGRQPYMIGPPFDFRNEKAPEPTVGRPCENVQKLALFLIINGMQHDIGFWASAGS